jgi:predicted Rossmann fold nucleotide-binding protein DprA/Smf involved in DNA uptake
MPALAGSLKLLEDGPFAPTSVDRLLGSLGVASAAGAHQGSRGVATGGLIYAIYDCRYNVLDTLSKGHLHVDAIVVQASQSAQAVTAALLTLALENVVVEGPPGLFRRRRAL